MALVAPIVARRRVASAIAARTGCADVQVGSLSLGLDGAELRSVAVGCAYGSATIDRVQVGLDYRSFSVLSVHGEGGGAQLHGRPQLPSQTGGWAQSQSHSTTSVSWRGAQIALLDGTGNIAAATIDVERVDGTWTVHARDVGTDVRFHPRVEADELEVVVSERQVRDCRVAGLELTATDGWSLEQALRGWARGDEGASELGTETSPRRRLWEYLAEGATVRVDEGVVRDRTGVALSELGVEVTRLEGARLGTRGHGQPRGEGRLSWDFTLDAEAEQLDGPLQLDDVPLSVFVPFLPPLPLHDPARALVSADVRLRTEDGGAVRFEGTFSVEGLALESARIASAPVLGIALSLAAEGRWVRSEHRLEIARGLLRMGAATATLGGAAMLHGDRYAFDVHAELPRTPCDAAVHAIPAGLLQDMAHMHLDGRIAASVVLAVDSEHLDDSVLRFSVDDRCTFTSVPAMADVTRFQAPFHHEVVEPDDSVFSMDTGPGTAAWTPITDISPFLVHAVLAHEDASFFSHRGFAPWAIRDALVRNLRERRYVLGASTITMQLVKNVFLRREKTLARKIQEVLLTWWVESAMTKAQILELYLNVIEYGPGVYGVRQAAAHYFGRSPSELSVAESAFLAMILPNPPSFHEQYDAGALTPSFRRRTVGFVSLLEQRGRIDADAALQGREELETFAFSRDGGRVGPEILRGGSAQLPMDGFSGFPAVSWSGSDEPNDGEDDGIGEEQEAAPDEWEEVWP
ncbi:MAG: transglycosylase domain-containing protein [Sandaracinaceae bacterium]|nr:transglycosylase domain-containing protein [Sandaracinaceae bacterium]